MKGLVFVTGVGLFVAGLTIGSAAQTQSIKGHLMDVACSTSRHASEAGFKESHDKKCLTMDSCVKSGYSVITADNKVLELDAVINSRVRRKFQQRLDHSVA